MSEDSGGWRMPKKVPTDIIPLLPRAIAEHEQALQLGSLDDLGIVLGRLLAHYHNPERGEASYRLLFEDYLDDLNEFPLAVVGEAARQWRRTKVFWPKVAELRELCNRIDYREHDRLARLRFLAWCADRFGGRVPEFKPRPEWPHRCPEQSDLDAAMRGSLDAAGIVVWELPPESSPEAA